MNFIRKLKIKYFDYKLNKINFSNIENSKVVRKNFVFYGKVQNVGFRDEMLVIANRLNLIGWVKNNKDGSVVAELEGEENKISFLLEVLNSIKRIKITKTETKEVELTKQETEFLVI